MRGSRRSCARPPRPGWRPAPGVAGLLAGEPEAALARVVSRLPEVVEDAVLAEETQGITAYATELATQFHAFYRDARVVDTEQPGALGAAARAGPGDADDARERARPAGDLRARTRCRPEVRPGAGAAHRAHAPALRAAAESRAASAEHDAPTASLTRAETAGASADATAQDRPIARAGSAVRRGSSPARHASDAPGPRAGLLGEAQDVATRPIVSADSAVTRHRPRGGASDRGLELLDRRGQGGLELAPRPPRCPRPCRGPRPPRRPGPRRARRGRRPSPRRPRWSPRRRRRAARSRAATRRACPGARPSSPSPRRVARSSGKATVDRLLARRRTCPGAAPARWSRAGSRTARRPPAKPPAVKAPSASWRPPVYGNRSGSLRIAGIRSRIASDAGSDAAGHLAQLLRRSGALRPEGHEQRRVTLDDGGAGHRPVALVRVLADDVAEHERLVLERVGVLVGVRDLLDRADPAVAWTRRTCASCRRRRGPRPGS